MLRDLWTAGSLVPSSHGSKVPSAAIFALRVITKKCRVSVLNVLHILNSFLAHITFAKNLFKKTACHMQKQKKQAPKFYFLPWKSKLAHKNWFDSCSSFKTHVGNKKAISVHCQNNKNTRSLGGEKSPMVIEPTLVKDPTSPLQLTHLLGIWMQHGDLKFFIMTNQHTKARNHFPYK